MRCRGFAPQGFGLVATLVGGLLVAVVLAAMLGYFVMLLWNWLMPTIFGVNTITYWQGAGLVLLARLLVGTHGHGGPKSSRRKWHGRHHRWNNWKHYDK